MNTTTTAAEFDAVDDDVVVRGDGFLRSSEEQVDVFGRLGCGKGVMGCSQTGGAALPWLRLDGWR